MKKHKPSEIIAKIPYRAIRYSGLTLQIKVPKIPKSAPEPWPNIKSSPFVAAGAIGKVSSEAKFIETGIIGTKHMPKNIKLMPTITLLKVTIVIIAIAAETITPVVIVLKANKNLGVLCKRTDTIRLEITPNIAVDAP